VFEGVYSVLPTPFTGAGDVDLPSITRVVDLVVKAGVNGMTALGVTGEVSRLTERERGQIVEAVVKAADGRAKVIVGASADGVRTCIEYTREAKALGAAAVMVSPPRMLKLNTESVVSHYKALAAAVDLPIVVQDYPPISGFAMEAALLARIAREVPSARTIKLEDPPTPFKTTRILAAAHYPAGKIDEAANVFYKFVPLMRFEFQEGIGMAIRKEVLKRRGVLADAATRAPGPTLDESTRKALDSVLAWTAKQEGASWILG